MMSLQSSASSLVMSSSGMLNLNTSKLLRWRSGLELLTSGT